MEILYLGTSFDFKIIMKNKLLLLAFLIFAFAKMGTAQNSPLPQMMSLVFIVRGLTPPQRTLNLIQVQNSQNHLP